MTDSRRPAPRPRPDAAPAAVEEPPAPAPECNLRGCDEPPEWRGLCSAHRQTHRGLADPKEPR